MTTTQISFLPDENVVFEEMDVVIAELDDFVCPEPDQDFINSVERFGIIDRIIVVKVGKRLVVADGRRRVRAAQMLGMEEVPAKVTTTNETMASVFTLIKNVRRAPNPVAEFEAITLLFKKGAVMDEIKLATGLDKADVDRLMKFGQVDEVIRRGVKDGKVAVSTAMATINLPPPVQEDLADQLQEKGKLLGKDVKAARTVAVQQKVDQLPAQIFDDEPEQEATPVHQAFERVTEEMSQVEVHLRNGQTELAQNGCMLLRQAVDDLSALLD